MARELCQATRSPESGLENRGFYILIMHLPRPTRISIGAIGTHRFAAGRYAYIGRAKRNLRQRIDRHRRRRKKTRWHIDYFLRHARIERVLTLPLTAETECSLAKHLLQLPASRVAVPGFGASDCRCGGHLIYLGRASRAVDFC